MISDVATPLQELATGARPEDVVSSSHVFPLRTEPGGIMQRQGHTEGSVELAVLAGVKPAAIPCELANPDGTMAKGKEIRDSAEQNDMVILSIEELVRNRIDELQLRAQYGHGGAICVDGEQAGLD